MLMGESARVSQTGSNKKELNLREDKGQPYKNSKWLSEQQGSLYFLCFLKIAIRSQVRKAHLTCFIFGFVCSR